MMPALALVCLAAVLSHGVTSAEQSHELQREGGAPLPPRGLDIQPEGASLRRMLEMDGTPVQSREGDDWIVFYDDSSGFPYYHNTRSGVTQWENPWSDGTGFSAADRIELQESWRLYDRFGRFRGIFDDLFAVRHRTKLPRAGA